jgi:hypothetical protein
LASGCASGPQATLVVDAGTTDSVDDAATTAGEDADDTDAGTTDGSETTEPDTTVDNSGGADLGFGACGPSTRLIGCGHQDSWDLANSAINYWAGFPDCDADAVENGFEVMYEIQADNGTVVDISLVGGTARAYVVQSSACTSSGCVGVARDGEPVTVTATDGMPIRIAVEGAGAYDLAIACADVEPAGYCPDRRECGPNGAGDVCGTCETGGCLGGLCVDPPTNDTCDTAQMLTIGTAVTPDTTAAQDDWSLDNETACGFKNGPVGEGGKDVMYTFQPDVSGWYTITATGVSHTMHLALSTTTCADDAKCIAAGQTELAVNLTQQVLYSLVVDGESASQSGSSIVTVAAAECPGLGSVLVDAGGGFQLPFTEVHSPAQQLNKVDLPPNSVCNPADEARGGGSDWTCEWTPQETVASVRVRLTATAEGAEPFLYASQCLDAVGGSCSGAVEAGEILTLDAVQGQPWVLVTDDLPTSGTFTLETYPPANDTCEGAFAAPSELSVEVTRLTAGAATDSFVPPTEGTCAKAELADSTASDEWIAFTAPANGRYRFEITDADFDSAIFLTASCAADAECYDAGYNDNGTGDLAWVTLATGETVYAVVTGAGSSAGRYTLSIDWVPDSCTSAAEVTLSDGTFSITVNTALGSDDITPPDGSCNLSGVLEGGRDLVWRFVPPQTGNYRVEAQNPAFDPVLMVLFGDTCEVATCGASSDAPGSGLSEDLTVSLTEGVPVWIVIDGYDEPEFGTATLAVTAL